MIYTVTFNPSIDYIVNVENFETGKVNRTCKEIMLPGGKGLNVSMVLKNLGIDSVALGFMAGFTGNEICRLMAEKDIKTDFINCPEGMSRINVKLRSGVESEINGMGPAIGREQIEELYKKLDCIKAGDTLVLAGSIPASMRGTIYRDIMKYLYEKFNVQDKQTVLNGISDRINGASDRIDGASDRIVGASDEINGTSNEINVTSDADGIRFVVDATGQLLVNVLEYHPFLVKPNNHELGEIFGTVLRGKDDIVFYAKKLQSMGAENVLVSMAGDGAILVTEDGDVFDSLPPKGKVVNSVGAGDSMVAGFLAALEGVDFSDKNDISGKSEDSDKAGLSDKSELMRRALLMGLCTGSASAFSENLATKQEVEKLMEQMV